jgi:hypothetical protein
VFVCVWETVRREDSEWGFGSMTLAYRIYDTSGKGIVEEEKIYSPQIYCGPKPCDHLNLS